MTVKLSDICFDAEAQARPDRDSFTCTVPALADKSGFF